MDLYIGMKWYFYWPLAMSLFIVLLSNENISFLADKGDDKIEKK